MAIIAAASIHKALIQSETPFNALTSQFILYTQDAQI